MAILIRLVYIFRSKENKTNYVKEYLQQLQSHAKLLPLLNIANNLNLNACISAVFATS